MKVNDVEVTIQQVNYSNGCGINMGLRFRHADLEPFIVRQWHFKDESTIQLSHEAITCLGKGMADILGIDLIRLTPMDMTGLRLDEDIYMTIDAEILKSGEVEP